MNSIEITIQGVEGCFHEAAAKEYFSKQTNIHTIPCETFQDMFETLDKNPNMLGIVAIETR